MTDLITKYSDVGNNNQQFQEQREKVETFFHNFYKNYKSVIRELESNLYTLKEKKFDSDMYKIFVKLWMNLADFEKMLDPEDAYNSIKKVINFVLSRNNLAVIDNLHFLISHFLSQNSVKLPQNQSILQQSKIDGLKKLKALILDAKEYIGKNPLLFVPGSIPPEAIKMLNESEEFIPGKIGPQDETKVFKIK